MGKKRSSCFRPAVRATSCGTRVLHRAARIAELAWHPCRRSRRPGSAPAKLLSRSATAPSCDASPTSALNVRLRPAAAGKASQASAGSSPSRASRVRTACEACFRSQRAARRSSRTSCTRSSPRLLAISCSTSSGRSCSVLGAATPGLLRAAIGMQRFLRLAFCERGGCRGAGARGASVATRVIGAVDSGARQLDPLDVRGNECDCPTVRCDMCVASGPRRTRPSGARPPRPLVCTRGRHNQPRACPLQ
jgi:hypothetical protein